MDFVRTYVILKLSRSNICKNSKASKMKLDKERFIQDLEEWHESHLDYYANFVEHIKEDGHNGLSGMMNVMSEFYPNTQPQIRDGMNNPSNDLSSAIERVKSSGFTEELVGRFQKGDDHAAAALCLVMAVYFVFMKP